jgi:hypothetical protein
VPYFYITDDTQVRWYPGLVLKVFWEEEAEPSIQVPLSDFFGHGRQDDVAFWYQEEPHQAFNLQPFGERTSPTHAVEYK